MIYMLYCYLKWSKWIFLTTVDTACRCFVLESVVCQLMKQLIYLVDWICWFKWFYICIPKNICAYTSHMCIPCKFRQELCSQSLNASDSWKSGCEMCARVCVSSWVFTRESPWLQNCTCHRGPPLHPSATGAADSTPARRCLSSGGSSAVACSSLSFLWWGAIC